MTSKNSLEREPSALYTAYYMLYAVFQTRAPKKQSPSARQLLEQKIAITDQQIDRFVYELYELTEDEIRIVEGS